LFLKEKIMKTPTAGVYVYWFKDTPIDPCEQSYVGSTINLKRRHSDHMSRLKSGTHSNKHFQNVYNKYKDQMVYEIVETVYFPNTYDYTIKKELLESIEQYYYEDLKSKLNNCQPGFCNKSNKYYNSNNQVLHNKLKKSVYLVDNNLVIIKKYDGVREAERDLNLCSSNISKVALLKAPHVKGYKFRFEDTLNKHYIAPIKIKKEHSFKNNRSTCKPIKCYLLDGTLTTSYPSIAVAAYELNLQESGIIRVLQKEAIHTGGYIFKHQDDNNNITLPKLKKRACTVDCYKNNIFYKSYDSCSKAAIDLNMNRVHVHYCGKTNKETNGFTFKLNYKY
jgi:hypothetical protein